MGILPACRSKVKNWDEQNKVTKKTYEQIVNKYIHATSTFLCVCVKVGLVLKVKNALNDDGS